ncbi:hypothetical protein NVS47_05890 [Dehalobacterium formicoaceticum]|uniref:Uncharacterized protein n=1 Tax=Dehalobacterium formicoaceticum TaxID=51515 RepID=A0ABT1Y3B0_9FIRM|nr:hypothetical protein [Dehalobacterium formicoaceticum]MCR6545048.1 hypothetical protein [Dehalobacterium formicoaceticum]
MAGHEEPMELMRKYPIPQTPEDVHKYTFIGYGVFAVCLIGVIALTLAFVS